jgi:hypothetical protein
MNKYYEFFDKLAQAYGNAGGHESILRRIGEGEFKDGLPEEQYQIAISEFHRFFEGRNTHGRNRIFGLSPKDIAELVAKCESKQI